MSDDAELEGVCWVWGAVITAGHSSKPVPGKHELNLEWVPYLVHGEPYRMHICLRCSSAVFVKAPK